MKIAIPCAHPRSGYPGPCLCTQPGNYFTHSGYRDRYKATWLTEDGELTYYKTSFYGK